MNIKKKIEALGVSLTEDPASVNDPNTRVVCVKVADFEGPHWIPHSIQSCSGCGEMLIVSESSPKIPLKICEECAMKEIGDSRCQFVMTPEILRECDLFSNEQKATKH